MIKKLILKYKALPIGTKAALWFIICSVIQQGGKFLAMPVLVRLLSTEKYGIYSVFLSWVNLISVFATLKLECAVMNNAMFKYSDKRSEYISSAQSISMTFTAGCFLIYLLFSSFFDKLFGLPSDFSVLIFAQLFFTESYLLWSARQRFEYKYIPLVISTAVLSVLYMLIPIIAAYAAPAELNLSAVVYSGAAVQIIFGACFAVYNYVKGKNFFNREYWKYAISFNLPLVPHYLSSIVLGQADRVMINNLCGSAQAGIYSFTYSISTVMNIVTTAVNNALVPYTYEKLKKRDFKNLQHIANFVVVMLAVMVLVFALVAPEIIKIFATEDYYESIFLIPIIALSAYFQFLYCLFANIEFYFEKNKFITVASIVTAAANVLLNWIFIPVFGYFAAGYTTLFCYILFSLAHYVFCRIVCKKELDRADVYNYRFIFAVSVLVICIAFAMLTIYEHMLIRYGIAVIVLVIAFVKRNTVIDNLKSIKNKRT